MNFDFFKRGSSAERKPLTEAQKQWRKKYLIVFPALFISFLGCLWLIFGGALSEESTDTGKANMELPDGSSDGIEGNKTKLMEEQAAQDAKQRQNVNISLFDSANGQSSDLNLAVQPDTVAPDNQAIQTSATTYQEVQASLDDFFIPENTEASQMAELQARIDELEAQNAMAQQPQQPDQMEMLERSYQLATQYMGNGNGGGYQTPPQPEEKGKRNVQPVAQVSRNVVSSLNSSSAGRGFNTSVGVKSVTARNTIAAVVAGNQSVIDGESVKLRTTEPMWIGNRLIPRNTVIVGSGRVQGERLEIEITSIECEGSIYDVELHVFDSDGQEGINIPQSMESDALHEIGANMGSTMGSSINISTNTGAQIASDVGRGLINGVSQYLTKKMRTVKVHLKAGYRGSTSRKINNNIKNNKPTKSKLKMKLKAFILSAIALIGMATPAFAKGKTAKNTDNNVSPDTETVAEHDMNVYGANYTDGDKFDGLTRKVGFDRMIPPHALEVAYEKTTHIIFPSEVVYVDLGNENLVAGLADGAKNVLRVKSAFKSFKTETNLSVITEDGSYYSFNVKFAKEPLLLNIEMTDFLHDGEAVNRPNNAQEIYLEKLGQESPMLVKLIMKSIYKQNKREIKHIGSKRFGVQFLLKSIYTNNGLLYFHTELKNTSNIAFDIDFVSFKIVDKKVIKRTAMQEQVLEPLRAQNYVTVVHGKSSERTVFALEKFTIPDDKQLVIEVAEKEGGRHQTFVVENEDIVRANVIDELSIL